MNREENLTCQGIPTCLDPHQTLICIISYMSPRMFLMSGNEYYEIIYLYFRGNIPYQIPLLLCEVDWSRDRISVDNHVNFVPMFVQ